MNYQRVTSACSITHASNHTMLTVRNFLGFVSGQEYDHSFDTPHYRELLKFVI